MTPLGHAGIALIAGLGASRIFPQIDQTSIIAATTIGGVALDFDLLYRFHQKGRAIFDGTIGQHRFFPSHTPLAVILICGLIALVNPLWAVFLAFGAMIHLVIDTLFFPEGINFLYPFNRKMVSLFTIKTHPFWAPKPISQVNGWWKNYFHSPLFWFVEVLPTLLAIVLLLRLV